MSFRVVRLGAPRHAQEGLRIGTVRRPPRGIPKSKWAAEDWYDVWFPNVAPSLALMRAGRSATTAREWSEFVRQYRSEMAVPAAKHDIELLATLSHTTDFSVGCYCEDEARCHRSVLKELLVNAGALPAQQ
jgi:uncharacterized protein YeaO (DUF488 family)